MKKYIALILSIVMVLSLFAGCANRDTTPPTDDQDTTQSTDNQDTDQTGTDATTPEPPEASEAQNGQEKEPVELIVFAATSMTETLDEIGALYMDEHPEVTILFNFDSSGTLKTQIEEGADCDLFLSAAQKQMNALDGSLVDDAEKNPDKLDFVLQGSRINLLENKVVLVVPDGNPAGILDFADVATCERIALGNDDVPVGQYSTEILTNLGLLDALESAGKITYGSNVKEVTSQVTENAVDCGIIYATDAFSAELEVVTEADKDLCKQVVYPAAVLQTAQNQACAQSFLDYLGTDQAVAIFENVGFTMVK